MFGLFGSQRESKNDDTVRLREAQGRRKNQETKRTSSDEYHAKQAQSAMNDDDRSQVVYTNLTFLGIIVYAVFLVSIYHGITYAIYHVDLLTQFVSQIDSIEMITVLRIFITMAIATVLWRRTPIIFERNKEKIKLAVAFTLLYFLLEPLYIYFIYGEKVAGLNSIFSNDYIYIVMFSFTSYDTLLFLVVSYFCLFMSEKLLN